jgi:hypothetical protein
LRLAAEEAIAPPIQISRGGVTNLNSSKLFGPITKGNQKSGSTLGTTPTTVVEAPSETYDTIKVTVPHAGNSAGIICHFTGSGGDPQITITNGTITQNYVRSGSSRIGTQISSGGYAVYEITSDPTIDKTFYVTLTFTPGINFSNLYAGPGNGSFLSTVYTTSSTSAGVTVVDNGIF